MKRLLPRFFFILLVIIMIPSCELLEDCKSCTLVTNDNGSISYGSTMTYCGDKLAEVESESPVTIGNKTTYWECQ